MTISFPINPYEQGRGRRRASSIDEALPDPTTLDADEILTKALGGMNIGQMARAATATFDPNAEDGDGDGLVQDSTPFERPAVFSAIPGIARGLRSATDTGPAYTATNGSWTNGKTNREIAEAVVPDNLESWLEMAQQQLALLMPGIDANNHREISAMIEDLDFSTDAVWRARMYVERMLEHRPALRALVDSIGFPPVAFVTPKDEGKYPYMGAYIQGVGLVINSKRIEDMPGYFWESASPTKSMYDPGTTLAFAKQHKVAVNWGDNEPWAVLANTFEDVLVHEYGHFAHYLSMRIHPDPRVREMAGYLYMAEWGRGFVDPEEGELADLHRVLGEDVFMLMNWNAKATRYLPFGNLAVDIPEDEKPDPRMPWVDSIYGMGRPVEFFAETFVTYFSPDEHLRKRSNAAAKKMVEDVLDISGGLRSSRPYSRSRQNMTVEQLADEFVPASREQYEDSVRGWYETIHAGVGVSDFEKFMKGPTWDDDDSPFGSIDNLDFSPTAVARNRADFIEALSKYPRFLEAVRQYGSYPIVSTRIDKEWDEGDTLAVTDMIDFPSIIVNGKLRNDMGLGARLINTPGVRYGATAISTTEDFLVDTDNPLVHEWGHFFNILVASLHPDEKARALGMFWLPASWDEPHWDSPTNALGKAIRKIMLSVDKRSKSPYMRMLAENVDGYKKWVKSLIKGTPKDDFSFPKWVEVDWQGYPHVASQYGLSSPSEAFAEAVSAVLLDKENMASPRMREQVKALLATPSVSEIEVSGGLRSSTGGLRAKIERAPDGTRLLIPNDPNSPSPSKGRDWLKDMTIDEILDAVVPVSADDAALMTFSLQMASSGIDIADLFQADQATFRDLIAIAKHTVDNMMPIDFSPAARAKAQAILKKAMEESPRFEWMVRNFGTLPVVMITAASVRQHEIDSQIPGSQKAPVDPDIKGRGAAMGLTNDYYIALNDNSVYISDWDKVDNQGNPLYPSGKPPSGSVWLKFWRGLDPSSRGRAGIPKDQGGLGRKIPHNLGISAMDTLRHEWAHSFWKRLVGPGRVFRIYAGRAGKAQKIWDKISNADILRGGLTDREARATHFFPGLSVKDAEDRLMSVREAFDQINFTIPYASVNTQANFGGALLFFATQFGGINVPLQRYDPRTDIVDLDATGADKKQIAEYMTRALLGALPALPPIFSDSESAIAQQFVRNIVKEGTQRGYSPGMLQVAASDFLKKHWITPMMERAKYAPAASGETWWNQDVLENALSDYRMAFPYMPTDIVNLPWIPTSPYQATNRQEMFAEGTLIFTAPHNEHSDEFADRYMPPEMESALAYAFGLKDDPDPSVPYSRPWETGTPGLRSSLNRSNVTAGLNDRTQLPYNTAEVDRSMTISRDTPGMNVVNIAGHRFGYLSSDLDADEAYRVWLTEDGLVSEMSKAIEGRKPSFYGNMMGLPGILRSNSLGSAEDNDKWKVEEAYIAAHSIMNAVAEESHMTDHYAYGAASSFTGAEMGDSIDIPLMSFSAEHERTDDLPVVLRLLPGASAHPSPVTTESKIGDRWAEQPIEVVTGGSFRVVAKSQSDGKTVVDLKHVAAYDPESGGYVKIGRKKSKTPRQRESEIRSALDEHGFMTTMSSVEPQRKEILTHRASEAMLRAERTAWISTLGNDYSEADKYNVPGELGGLRSSVPLEERAKIHGVSLDAFNDEAFDDDDVEWSSNDWSLGKVNPVEAGDVVVVRTTEDGRRLILGISRKSGPFRGAVALPGGLRDEGEDLFQTAAREMKEEVNIDPADTSASRVLGHVEARDWDPRFVEGGKIAGVRYDIDEDSARRVKAGDDASKFEWIDVEELSKGDRPIAFGHATWLAEAFADDPVLGPRFLVLAEASRRRNQRLMARIDKIREKKGAKQFGQLPEPNEPYKAIREEGLDSVGLRSASGGNIRLRAGVESRVRRILDNSSEELDDTPSFSMSSRKDLDGEWARDLLQRMSRGEMTEEDGLDVISLLQDLVRKEMRKPPSAERDAKIEDMNELSRRVRSGMLGGTKARKRENPELDEEESFISDEMYKRLSRGRLRETSDDEFGGLRSAAWSFRRGTAGRTATRKPIDQVPNAAMANSDDDGYLSTKPVPVGKEVVNPISNKKVRLLTAEDSARHLFDGGSLDEIPDLHLLDAIFEQTDYAVQYGALPDPDLRFEFQGRSAEGEEGMSFILDKQTGARLGIKYTSDRHIFMLEGGSGFMGTLREDSELRWRDPVVEVMGEIIAEHMGFEPMPMRVVPIHSTYDDRLTEVVGLGIVTELAHNRHWDIESNENINGGFDPTQTIRMSLFDVVTGNSDRHPGNALVARESGSQNAELVHIDGARVFGTHGFYGSFQEALEKMLKIDRRIVGPTVSYGGLPERELAEFAKTAGRKELIREVEKVLAQAKSIDMAKLEKKLLDVLEDAKAHTPSSWWSGDKTEKLRQDIADTIDYMNQMRGLTAEQIVDIWFPRGATQ